MRDLERWLPVRARWAWWRPRLTCGGCQTLPCLWALLPPWVSLASTPARPDTVPECRWVKRAEAPVLTAIARLADWSRWRTCRGAR
jgi:hypothetical protein